MRTRPAILSAPETCWRICAADRAALLIDGESYFAALRSALLKARRSVFIVGWDIDSRTRLVSKAEEKKDRAPGRLGDLLRHIAEAHPELRVHLLLWDYSVLFALDREPMPALNLGWRTPPQVRVCLDDVLPLGASHHQKIVVVDDAVAFCGGLDLTIRRWDTSHHRAEQPGRVDPQGKPYGPFHDVQMAVDGAAAAALSELVRERWAEAACERPIAVEPVGDPWPDGVRPDFVDVEIGIARTRSELHGRPAVREVEALYLRAIEAANRRIYLENQYLTADRVGEVLARRMREVPELEVVLVTPKEPEGWLEAQVMGAGRLRFMRRLRDAGVESRVRLLYPAVSGPAGATPVMVHAKLMVVDEVLLRVGSSNLNNRSMGLDTECDLAIDASTPEQERAVAGIRDRLLAEHLGVPEADVRSTLTETGSLLATVDRLSEDGGRSLLPVTDDERFAGGLTDVLGEVADAERPAEAERVVGQMFGAVPAKRPISRLVKLTIAAVGLVAIVLAWRFSPLSDLTDPGRLGPWMESVAGSGWAYLLMPAIYVLAGLVVFPITVLIAATAMAFGPWTGFALAVVGSLLSASITYLIGRLAGRPVLRDRLGARVNRISRALGRKGVLSVATLRMVPVAPFTLINLVAGASHIGFRDYLLGTVLGMAPGIAVMTALGDRLRRVWEDPSAGQLVLLALVVGVWILLSVGLQFLVSRLGRRRDAGDR